VLEDGEFKYGSMNDGKETYSVATYGRIIGISRQALINDDLNAFDRIPRALGGAARRLENRTVYDILTGNGALSDTGQLFNATRCPPRAATPTSTGTGSVLSLTVAGHQRAAMRVQKGKAAEELNVAPAYLIGPAALEQSMYQFTSSQFVPGEAVRHQRVPPGRSHGARADRRGLPRRHHERDHGLVSGRGHRADRHDRVLLPRRQRGAVPREPGRLRRRRHEGEGPSRLRGRRDRFPRPPEGQRRVSAASLT
jgi:hypothetical protein